MYVLWWNYDPPSGSSAYAAATSISPTGPFKVVNQKINVTREHGGDYALFVDDDGTGYLVYSADYWMGIEKLTPDFLHSTGQVAICNPNGSHFYPEYFVEAPVFFKRNNLYYVLFGHCCCFCDQGSGVLVHTAANPLGPWRVQVGGDVACNPPQVGFSTNSVMSSSVEHVMSLPTPGQGCLYNSNEVSVTRSQQNFIVKVEVEGGRIEYVWTGDRWQQAPDGIKGHEPQFWVPLEFGEDGVVVKIRWVDQFELDVL